MGLVLGAGQLELQSPQQQAVICVSYRGQLDGLQREPTKI
jgi:hypothetical protein